MSQPRVSRVTGLFLFTLACDPTPRPSHHARADEAKPCEDFELDVERVWSKQTRARVHAGIAGVDASSGKVIAERVVTRMDAVTRDWVMMQQRVCIDTVVHEIMPAEVYTKITGCLLTNLAQQRQIVLIASAPNLAQVELLERSIIDAGNDAAACLDRAIYSFYDDGEQAGIAREAIAEAKVLRNLGDSEGASEALARGSQSANQTQSDPIKVTLDLEAGWLAYSRADYAEAKRLADQARALASEIDYEIGLADALQLGGVVARTQGDYETAAKLLQQALEIYERLLGSEHYRSALALASVGALRDELGQYDDALELYQRSHAVLERTLGSESFEVATSYARLANLRLAMGDPVGASELYGKARGILEAVLGPNAAELTPIDRNLALILARQGKFEPALELATKALATSERVHGPNHPGTADAHTTLAEVLVTGGRHDDALLHVNEALAVHLRVFGEFHAFTATTWHLIGFVYSERGDPRRAIESYQKALAISDRIYGPNHPSTALTLREIGLEYTHQRDFARALEHYLRAADIQARMSTPASELADTHQQIGLAYEAQGNPTKAWEHNRKAAAEYERAGMHEHAGVLYTVIGTYHYNKGELDAALDAYVKAEALLTLARGSADANVKELRYWLVEICKQRKRHPACSK